MMSYFPTEPARPEHERVRDLMKMLFGDGPVRRPMGLLDPRGVALAQAANAAGRGIPPAALYEDAEQRPEMNRAAAGFGADAGNRAVASSFGTTEHLRPEHARVRNLMKMLLGDAPVRRPMGLLDPRGVALAQAANAAGREIPVGALYEHSETPAVFENATAEFQQAQYVAAPYLGFFARPPVGPKVGPPAPRPFKEPIPRLSGKEGAKNVPDWARGQRPHVDETGTKAAERVMDGKYGPGNYTREPGSEFSKLRKYFDRSFRTPKDTKSLPFGFEEI